MFVYLMNRSNVFSSGIATVTSGTAQSATVNITVPAARFIAGEYVYVAVALATSSAQMSAFNYNYYGISTATGTTYDEVLVTGMVAGTTVHTGITATTLTVSAAAAPTPIAVTFASLPYVGTVTALGNSYYAVSGVTLGTDYTISLTGLTADANLYFYNIDGTFATTSCSSVNTGTSNELCRFTVTGTTVYIKVTSAFAATGFTLGMVVSPAQLASYTFEGLGTMPVVFTGSGTLPWVINSTNGGALASANSMASGAITHSQTSCTAITTTQTAIGSVSFYYKTDSELSFDKLLFSVNNVQQNTGGWSGQTPWTMSPTYTLPIGTNTLQWCYSKDGSVSSGLDKVWVDNITVY
jgi:hypothetical protein